MFETLTKSEVEALYQALTGASEDGYRAVKFAAWLKADDTRYSMLNSTWREIMDLRVSVAEAASRHHVWAM